MLLRYSEAGFGTIGCFLCAGSACERKRLRPHAMYGKAAQATDGGHPRVARVHACCGRSSLQCGGVAWSGVAGLGSGTYDGGACGPG